MTSTRSLFAVLIAALAVPALLGQIAPGQAFAAPIVSGDGGIGGIAAAADSARFADGTRAINDNRWADAVSIFSHVADQHGEHADGALYWKAYAENKLGHGQVALDTCNELRTSYARSRWRDDCGALAIEIRGRSGQPTPPQTEQDDDLKLLALNSLMRQDETRALPQIQDVLNSASPERSKERAVFILAMGHTAPARDLLTHIARGDAPTLHSTPALQASAARLLNNEAPPGQASAASAATAENIPQAPTLRTETRAVVVDVVVTKGHDEPVGSLHKQDFLLSEDGKPQSIDFFEEHTPKALPAGAVAPLPPMPPGVYSNVPPAPESDSVNVLLLDSLNTDMIDQSYVRQQMINFLKSMQPGTRVAIFTLSSRLRMVQGFTTDSSILRKALIDKSNGVSPQKTPMSRSLQDKIDDVEHLETMQAMMGGHSDAGIEAIAQFQADFTSYQADQRVEMTLSAMQQLARYLAGVPGRKNLLWFSSSFPLAIFPRVGEKQSLDQVREYSGAVRQTADLLTVSKVAVYPIGAEGVMSDNRLEASVAGPTDYENGQANAGGTRASDKMAAAQGENAARASKIASMEQLAEDTGGHAYFNTNDLNAATQHAIADGAHYYTLAYTPTNRKMDGQYRHIEVKLSGSGYKLSYRRGYNADSAAMAVAKSNTDPLQPLMQRGMPSATQVLYGVRVLPASAQPAADSPRAGRNTKLTEPTTRYTADFMIRWSDVHLDAASDGSHNGKIQVALIAYDREGKQLNWTVVTQGMALKPDIYAAVQKSGIPAHLEIDLPSNQPVYLSTGVYDWTTGKAGTLEIPLRTPATAAASATPTAR